MVIFDIEADGFLHEASNVWCIVAKSRGKYLIYLSSDEGWHVPDNAIVWHNLDKYLEYVFTKEQVWVGHNIISYDLPLLTKLAGFKYKVDPKQMCDTHILSRLFTPDRLGHSLEWFGEKFGYPKGDHNDWTCLSQEMIDYCIRDVDLTEKVYEYLMLEQEGWDWSEAIKLEYNVWHIQQKQESHGVLFDKKAAENLLEKIQEEIQQLEFEIQSELPLFPKDRGTLKKIFLKSGEYTEPVKEWMNATV
jgi:DNA polymerase I-like protein with 3'-5' exonuclease and polymerase domains